MSERVRLFVCGQCATIEEMPWFEGPQEYDDTGNLRLSQHRYATGLQHPYTVGDVDKAEWSNPSFQSRIIAQLMQQIQRGNPESGLGKDFYDVKNTFQDDALECWKRHGRRVNCEDYMSDRMLLLPHTRAERKAEGLDYRHRPSTKLCQFCPVHSHVVQLQRAARGDYDKQPWED